MGASEGVLRCAVRDLAPCERRSALIGYGANSPTGRDIARAFAAVGITPNFVVRASDSDVIKMYVAKGLGVGIVRPCASNMPLSRAWLRSK
ncbi:MAG: hypothetical protein J2P19_34090 [Pseudonocardia sp.]|nr:hypothetical protein [Pseudonocardia sp.]